MIRILSFAFIILLFHLKGFSQKRFFSEKSNITFFSEGVIEEIKASNTKVTSILDLLTGDGCLPIKPKRFSVRKKIDAGSLQ
jgi:hypothetical protein